MTGQLSTTHSFDGADQGFLASYFPDLLDSPLFRPPPPDSGRLNGTFRLPMGYQMDHIYYCECCTTRFYCLFVFRFWRGKRLGCLNNRKGQRQLHRKLDGEAKQFGYGWNVSLYLSYECRFSCHSCFSNRRKFDYTAGGRMQEKISRISPLSFILP
jgi:hypothetical protein